MARQPDGAGTLAAVVTPDGKFAFVLNEYGTASDGGNIAVVSIKRDSHGNFTSETRTLGYIPTAGSALDGLALSRDGRRLFVSSEVGHTNTTPSSSGWPLLYRLSGCKQGPGTDMPSGIVSVIDVAKAVAHPDATAVISTIAAGCSPGRMALTADGKVLWVLARGDNRVLAFNPAAPRRIPIMRCSASPTPAESHQWELSFFSMTSCWLSLIRTDSNPHPGKRHHSERGESRRNAIADDCRRAALPTRSHCGPGRLDAVRDGLIVEQIQVIETTVR